MLGVNSLLPRLQTGRQGVLAIENALSELLLLMIVNTVFGLTQATTEHGKELDGDIGITT